MKLCATLSAIDLHHATAVALHALRLEALAAATVTLDALDLQALASATASTLETLGLAAATASLTLDTLRLAATAFAAAAARFRFGLVAAMSAAGLCRERGCNRQRRNASPRNSLVMRNLLQCL